MWELLSLIFKNKTYANLPTYFVVKLKVSDLVITPMTYEYNVHLKIKFI